MLLSILEDLNEEWHMGVVVSFLYGQNGLSLWGYSSNRFSLHFLYILIV